MELSEKLDRICDIRKPKFMIHNLHFAAAMCRIHYYRVPEALPEAGDISRQAEYWKAHYNTPLGAGTEQEYLTNWYKYSGMVESVAQTNSSQELHAQSILR
jgi:hypothetical protein